MAAVASRSSLVGALLRNAVPINRHIVLDFLQGLSATNWNVSREFQGACILEVEYSENCNPYRLMSDFFDPAVSERWANPDDRAHKMFVVLAYLDHLEHSIQIRFQPKSFNNCLTTGELRENSGRIWPQGHMRSPRTASAAVRCRRGRARDRPLSAIPRTGRVPGRRRHGRPRAHRHSSRIRAGLAFATCLGALVFGGHRAVGARPPHPPPTLSVRDNTPAIFEGCVVDPALVAADRERFTVELAPRARAQVSLSLRATIANPNRFSRFALRHPHRIPGQSPPPPQLQRSRHFRCRPLSRPAADLLDRIR